MSIKTYKCKGCGSILTYNPKGKNLMCSHCESCYEIDWKKSRNIFHNFKRGYQPEKNSDLKDVYTCKVCGSIHTIERNSVFERCSMCGSIDFDKTTGMDFKPDNFVPFSISKKGASEKFLNWLISRKFAPNKLKKFAKQKKLSGSYVPMWRFVYDYKGHYTGVVVDTYRDSEGRGHETSRSVSGYVSGKNKNKDFSATSSVPYGKSMGAFRKDDSVEFNEEATLGFSVVNLNYSADSAYSDLESYVRNKIISVAEIENPRIKNVDVSFELSNVKVQYNYVPVWINYYEFKGKNYRCFVNGNNGDVAGKYPKSFWKILFAVLGGIALVGLLVGLFLWMVYLFSSR